MRNEGFVPEIDAVVRWSSVFFLVALLGCGVGCGVEGRSSEPAHESPTRTGKDTSGALRLATLRAMQRAPGYDFTQGDGAPTARIGVGEVARVRVSADRIDVEPRGRDAADAFSLRTVRIGASRELDGDEEGSTRTTAVGQEVHLDRGGVIESYLAGPLGLEQSYRVDAYPVSAGALTIEVAFDGVRPVADSPGSEAIRLVGRSGRTVAFYRDLVVVDAAGRALHARMEVDGPVVRLVIDCADASFPIDVDPLVALHQAELFPSGAAAGFAGAVSISGDTAIVGGHSAGEGAAYVFVRSGGLWTQQAKLVASGEVGFGSFVSISGDTAIVGSPEAASVAVAPGTAHVYVRTGASWSEQAQLVASDGIATDFFGIAGALSGDLAVIGAFEADVGATVNQGAAYVFERTGTTWTERAKLTPQVAGDWALFGSWVGLSGGTAIIGAPFETVGPNQYQGAAYVFTLNGAAWSEEARLEATDAAAFRRFGHSVSISGDTAVIGSFGAPGPQGPGAAYVFARSGAQWTQQVKWIDGSELFGVAVGVSGDVAVVGAPSSGAQPGSATIYARSGGLWSDVTTLAPADGAAEFGVFVAIDGDTALVAHGSGDAVTGPSTDVYVLHETQGAPCATAAECPSGFCVDGVCCDTVCGAGPCDACSIAAGAPTNGTCAWVSAPCDDGDACTLVDACDAGSCVGQSLVQCTAADECHVDGTCDAASGDCSILQKADGSPCSGGECLAGECVPDPTTGTSSATTSGGGGAVDSYVSLAGGCGCRVGGRSSSTRRGSISLEQEDLMTLAPLLAALALAARRRARASRR